MFLERFKEVENFTITQLALGGSKKFISSIRKQTYCYQNFLLFNLLIVYMSNKYS